ncbi:hypothetical protein JXB02_03860 [Candidatus Woesearchaeota archaeon]|nr:hypothetical protein [Candidatus Woesearchaeota archaeon]
MRTIDGRARGLITAWVIINLFVLPLSFATDRPSPAALDTAEMHTVVFQSFAKVVPARQGAHGLVSEGVDGLGGARGSGSFLISLWFLAIASLYGAGLLASLAFSGSKRGIIEVQFNWVFTIIIGALLLVFFISIVNKQRQGADLTVSSIILSDLNSILVGSKVSTGTLRLVQFPEATLGFSCDEYYVNGIPKQIKERTIFAPDSIKGESLLVWAEDWGLPFKVTNFLYVTSPEVRYVIYNLGGGSVLARELNETLPAEITKEVVTDLNDLYNLPDQNNYKVRIVLFGYGDSVPPIPTDLMNSMPDGELTVINITVTSSPETSPLDGYGRIDWWEKEGTGFALRGSSPFIRKESVHAAVIAEDFETYECIMEKSFQHANLVAQVYLNRSDTLRIWHQDHPPLRCAGYHDTARTALNAIIANTESYTSTSVSDVFTQIQSLNENNDLLELYSCSLIY